MQHDTAGRTSGSASKVLRFDRKTSSLTALLSQGWQRRKTIAHVAAAATCLQVCVAAAATPPSTNSAPQLTAQEEEAERMKELLQQILPPPLGPLPAPSTDVRDLNGTWIPHQITPLHMSHDAYGKEVPMTPENRKLLEERQKAVYVDKAPAQNAGQLCLPPGPPKQIGLLTPFTILQSPSAVIFMSSEYHMVWGASLSSAPSAPDTRTYMGQSTGHWEGDTLVIETRNFKDDLWLDPDGMAASKDARVTMRIKRIVEPEQLLEIATTIDDPKMFTAPWTFTRTYAWRPDMELFEEYDCEPQVYADWAAYYNFVSAGKSK